MSGCSSCLDLKLPWNFPAPLPCTPHWAWWRHCCSQARGRERVWPPGRWWTPQPCRACGSQPHWCRGTSGTGSALWGGPPPHPRCQAGSCGGWSCPCSPQLEAATQTFQLSSATQTFQLSSATEFSAQFCNTDFSAQFCNTDFNSVQQKDVSAQFCNTDISALFCSATKIFQLSFAIQTLQLSSALQHRLFSSVLRCNTDFSAQFCNEDFSAQFCNKDLSAQFSSVLQQRLFSSV